MDIEKKAKAFEIVGTKEQLEAFIEMLNNLDAMGEISYFIELEAD